jgi:acetyl esterase/lipase
VLDVWPGRVPGENGEIGEEKFQDPDPNDKKPIKRLANVTKPTLTVYRPAKEKDNGASVVICPGGGYFILAWDLEGEEVAEWLNSIGVTGILLKYRVPKRADLPRHVPPLQDAQRALSLVRSKVTEWNIDPQRIGMLGFSAGGHLTAAASTNYDKRTYEAIDDIDRLSCRPDFAVLIYPGGIVEQGEMSPEIRVSQETPPTFFAHANDDPVSPENSALLYLALKRAGVSSELHIFASGGHGFGLRPSEHPCSAWPKRCEEWLKIRGFLEQRKDQ